MKKAFLFIAFISVLLFCSDFTYANGRPYQSGQSGDLSLVPDKENNIHVTREILNFDFDETCSIANIHVLYELYNDNASVKNSAIVFFAAGQDVKNGFKAVFNGKNIPVERINSSTLSNSIDVDKNYYDLTKAKMIIQLEPKSQNTLEVLYTQKCGRVDYFSTNYYFPVTTASYSLSPASHWASFKNLSIKINIPSNYELVKSDFNFIKKEGIKKTKQGIKQTNNLYTAKYKSLPDKPILELEVAFSPPIFGGFILKHEVRFIFYGISFMLGLILGLVLYIIAKKQKKNGFDRTDRLSIIWFFIFTVILLAAAFAPVKNLLLHTEEFEIFVIYVVICVAMAFIGISVGWFLPKLITRNRTPEVLED